MPYEWSNWSGSVRCEPRQIAMPADEASLAALVRGAAAAGLGVRVAGTGHSFMPLVATDGVLVSLDAWTGIESHDIGRCEATVRAGTKLHDLGGPLLDLGLAMANLGDVDVQSVGGAVGTGTHGTGPTLGNISSQVTALRLVTADGEIVTCSEDDQPELLRATRVSLGALGMISAATLRLRPAYRLQERVWQQPIDACMERLLHSIAANTRFEFFWFPASDEAECKTLNPTDLPADEPSPELAMGTPASLAPDAPRQPAERERVGWSAHVIPSVRERKFNEMEYAVPAAAGPECFRQVRARMLARHPEVLWPVEYRTLASDDAYLSPAFGRETVTISIHQDARLPFREFFSDIEPIFRAHAGRPHWGKIHGLTAAELAPLYPMWAAFAAIRTRMDPAGRFLNHHLRAVLGVA